MCHWHRHATIPMSSSKPFDCQLALALLANVLLTGLLLACQCIHMGMPCGCVPACWATLRLWSSMSSNRLLVGMVVLVPATHTKCDSAMIINYQESLFDDLKHCDAKSGELVGENGEVKALKQHANGLRGCMHMLLMQEHMIQDEEWEMLMMLEIWVRRPWSTKRCMDGCFALAFSCGLSSWLAIYSHGSDRQWWMGLGTPLQPSRLTFSWTPDLMQYDSSNTAQAPTPASTVYCPPPEEIEQ